MMRALPPLALLLLSACSLGGRLPGGAMPPAPEHGLSRSAVQRSIGAGRVAIDSAAREGDTALMRAHFTADAAVEIDGAAGVGADAFADHLRAIAGGHAIYRVQLVPARFQHCTDGASEGGGELLVAMLGDTVVTPYSARWLVDDHGVRLQRLTVGDGAERAARRDICPSRAVADLGQRRVHLWVLPPYASAVHWNNGDDFQQVLTRAGYGSGRINNLVQFSEHYRGTVKEGMSEVGAAGIRVRLAGQLALEAQSTLRPSQSTIQGRTPSGESHVSLKHSGTFTSAGLSHEYRRIRLGAGPFVAKSDWTLRETAWALGTAGAQSIVTENWKTSDSGLAVDVGYAMPLARFITVNVRGQYRTMASTEIPTTHIDPPTISVGGYTIGTSFGLTF